MSTTSPYEGLPQLTHLQFLVLSLIGPRQALGGQVRSRMAHDGVRLTAPAFYQLMARLEDAGLVTGQYVRADGANRALRFRAYRVTGAGVTAVNQSREFYYSRVTPGVFPAWEKQT